MNTSTARDASTVTFATAVDGKSFEQLLPRSTSSTGNASTASGTPSLPLTG